MKRVNLNVCDCCCNRAPDLECGKFCVPCFIHDSNRRSEISALQSDAQLCADYINRPIHDWTPGQIMEIQQAAKRILEGSQDE